MILADTSVWVDHLRNGNRLLTQYLIDDQVICHPFIIGELACGHLKRRREILSLLDVLPKAQTLGQDEAMRFLEARQLMGVGIGWIDVHLLASAVLSNARLWTLDSRLRKAAQAQQVGLPGR